MAKKRISEAQAKKIVQEVANGAKPADLAKKYGFSLGTYYNWRAKFGGSKPKAAKTTAKKKAAPKKRGRKAAPKAKAKAVAKAAPKKRGRKAAAPKAKVAAKAAPKKRGPKPGAKRRGRKPAAAKRAGSPKSATAIKSRILALQSQIKAANAEISQLKSVYADAVFG